MESFQCHAEKLGVYYVGKGNGDDQGCGRVFKMIQKGVDQKHY